MNFGIPTLSRSTFSGQKAPGHLHGDCERMLPQFLMNLGLHLEAISGQFWSHAGTLWAKVATQIPKKGLLREVQNQDPKKVDFGTSWEGVRRVHSCTIAQFSLFRPDPLWLHFGSHFGIDLEAQIATILLLCRRWSSIDRLLGFLFDVHSQQGSSRGLATLDALSTGNRFFIPRRLTSVTPP